MCRYLVGVIRGVVRWRRNRWRPGSVLVKQKLDAIMVLRGDDESDMMPFVQTPDDLWFLVPCGIGVFLAGKCDDDARVVLLRLRQLVGAWFGWFGGCLNFSPLAP